MGARKHALADFDRADRAGVTAVDAGFAVEDVGANELGFEFEEDAVDFVHVRSFGAGGFGVGDELGFAGGIDFAELFRTGLLGADAVGFLEPASQSSTMRATRASFFGAGCQSQAGLPASATSSLMAWMQTCMALWPAITASSIVFFRKDVGLGFNHETARSVPATTRSRRELLSSSVVGLMTISSLM